MESANTAKKRTRKSSTTSEANGMPIKDSNNILTGIAELTDRINSASAQAAQLAIESRQLAHELDRLRQAAPSLALHPPTNAHLDQTRRDIIRNLSLIKTQYESATPYNRGVYKGIYLSIQLIEAIWKRQFNMNTYGTLE